MKKENKKKKLKLNKYVYINVIKKKKRCFSIEYYVENEKINR